MLIDRRHLESIINENCSIYALTSGSISFQDFYNHSWSQNFTDSFLPAYYLTNCSIADLREISLLGNLHSSNLTRWEYGSHYHTYDKTDNGDAFVALLFSISGTCVSCWMLTLLMFLSPKHKRKPWLTQLATVFYSILATIILSNITDSTAKQYYNDSLNLIKLHNLVYVSNSYRAMVVFSQLFTQLAWLQIVAHISRLKFKWYSIILYLILILTFTVIHAIYQAKYNNNELIFNSSFHSPYQRWRFVILILRLVIVTWLAVSLLYYTAVIKNPRKICYSRKLFPIAVSSLALFVIYIVINILSLSLYLNDWQVRSWLILISYLIEIGILTAIWEWVYGIEFLEKRYEIMGMLGRRISLNDVISFNLYDNNDPVDKKNKIKKYLDVLIKKLSGENTIDQIMNTQEESSQGADSHLIQRSNSSTTEHHVTYHPCTEVADAVPENNNDSNSVHTKDNEDIAEICSRQNSGSYDDVYIDDYEFSDEDQNTTSSNPNR